MRVTVELLKSRRMTEPINRPETGELTPATQEIRADLMPVVVLVETQMGENIGAAARAMANFGLHEMRIVNPRDGWPNYVARANASRADHVIDAAKVYETYEEAIADLSYTLATTARGRDMYKPVIGPDEAAHVSMARAREGQKVGLIFGRERWGLTNDEVALADAIVTLPVDPNFSSLNVAQAVLVLAYEWRKLATGGALPFGEPDTKPASRENLSHLFTHLERALEDASYFRPPEKREHMVRNIRTMITRGAWSEQEVRTFRGVIAALERRHEEKQRNRVAARFEGNQN